MRWNRGTRNSVGHSLPVTRLASWLVCAMVVIGVVPAGWANTVVFATGPQNLTLNSIVYPENATATFDITSTGITVHLLNLTVNPFSVNQAIGSLQFTINGATGTLTPTIGSHSDVTFGLDGSGGIHTPASQPTTTWSASLVPLSTTAVALCVVCNSTATADLIVGGPLEPTDKYTLAGTSLTTTNNQWIIGSGITYATGQKFATFDTSPAWLINFGAGVDLTNVVITNVIFGFGEGAPYGSGFLPAEEVPEPGSVILFGTGLGLLAIAAGARRLRRR
jgi:PEP-CTERM motif